MAKYTYMIENGNVFYTSHPEYHKQAENLTQAKGKEMYKEQCRQNLLKRIKPKQTIYTDVKSVSSSGVSRSIACYIVEDGAIVNISGFVAEVTGHKWSDKNDGVIVSGCGMDMCFHLVYCLGTALWPNGTEFPHGTRNGEPDNQGGYALKHSNI